MALCDASGDGPSEPLTITHCHTLTSHSLSHAHESLTVIRSRVTHCHTLTSHSLSHAHESLTVTRSRVTPHCHALTSHSLSHTRVTAGPSFRETSPWEPTTTARALVDRAGDWAEVSRSDGSVSRQE